MIVITVNQPGSDPETRRFEIDRIRIGRDGDMRVAGHDDHPAAAFTCPSLTTVAQDTAGLAARAIEISLDMIAGGAAAVTHERRASRLVLRESA